MALAAWAPERMSSHQGFMHDAAGFDVLAHAQNLTGYACRFRLDAYDDLLFPGYSLCLPPQLARAVAKRRAEFLAGRICAQRALARLGIAATDIAIGPDREPLWPAGAIASISHAGDRAVCIATTDPRMIGLGIDIESRIDARLAGEIRGVVVDADEQALIEAGFDDAVAGLAATFSAKEALYKALYPQVRAFFGFEAMRLAQVAPGRLRFLATADLAPTVRAGQAFDAEIEFADGGVRSIVCCLREGG